MTLASETITHAIEAPNPQIDAALVHAQRAGEVVLAARQYVECVAVVIDLRDLDVLSSLNANTGDHVQIDRFVLATLFASVGTSPSSRATTDALHGVCIEDHRKKDLGGFLAHLLPRQGALRKYGFCDLLHFSAFFSGVSIPDGP